MPLSYASTVIDSDHEKVWAVVADFNGLPTWTGGLVAASEIEPGPPGGQVGCVRKLTLPDGGIVRERLVILDDATRSYTYDILDSPFPIRRYRATVQVHPITDCGQAFVAWWTQYDCDADKEAELDTLFSRDVFATALNGLRQYLTSPAHS